LTTIVRAAALVDGTGAPPVPSAEVRIDDAGRIAYAGPAAGAPRHQGPARVYDLPGATLLPGLIDCHAHPAGIGAESVGTSEVSLALSAVGRLDAMLRKGITSVRVPGAPGVTSLGLRDAQADGRIAGPRLLVAGPVICPTGGHGNSWGIEADGADGVRKAVRQLFKQGVDFIKVTASGGGTTAGTHMGRPTFTVAELRAAVEEAAQHGSYVTAHCHSSEAMERVIEAGVRMIEHATFFNAEQRCEFIPELADRLAQTGTVVCPTIAVNARWIEERSGRLDELTEQERALYRLTVQRWERRMDIIAELHRRGVALIVGSDAPARGVPFDDFAYSVALHARAGVPPLEAIRSATGLAAAHLGLGQVTGTLQAGLDADLIAVAGDPVADLSALDRVRLVVQRGRVVVGDVPADGRLGG
jgi:imidazolonepropionase-like amidohydrolase